MTLKARLEAVTTRIATEFKAIRTLIGGSGTSDVSALNTVATDLTSAVNEVKETADNAAGRNTDAIAEGTTNLYFTDARADVRVQNAINDAGSGTSILWSSTKTAAEIAAATAALINSAPGALDTLDELAAALGDDANFGATMTTALSVRLRLDAAGGYSAAQIAQGQANLNVYDKDELGTGLHTTDFVALFETGLA